MINQEIRIFWAPAVEDSGTVTCSGKAFGTGSPYAPKTSLGRPVLSLLGHIPSNLALFLRQFYSGLHHFVLFRSFFKDALEYHLSILHLSF